MCRYYAHAFACKHITLTFARFCDPACLIQTPCTERHIWQTLSLDDLCEDCKEFYEPADQRRDFGRARRGKVRTGRS